MRQAQVVRILEKCLEQEKALRSGIALPACAQEARAGLKLAAQALARGERGTGVLGAVAGMLGFKSESQRLLEEVPVSARIIGILIRV